MPTGRVGGHWGCAVPAVGAGVVVGETALPHVHPALPARLRLVPPREHRLLQTSAGGVLPLRLGRQALARPGSVRGGVIPGHVHHRVVGAVDEIGPRPLGMPPAGSVHLTPPGSRSHSSGVRETGRKQPSEDERPPVPLGLRHVARGGREGAEVRIGNGASVDPIGAHSHLVDRAFAVARDRPLVLRTHPERGRLQTHHARSVTAACGRRTYGWNRPPGRSGPRRAAADGAHLIVGRHLASTGIVTALVGRFWAVGEA